MTWLLAERSRVTRFHDADRDTLADTYRAYAPGLVAWLRTAPRTHDGVRPLCALDIDDIAIETVRRAFEKEARLRFDGPLPYATALVPLARDVERAHVAQNNLAISGDDVDAVWRGQAIPRARHALVSAFAATLLPAERAIFDLRFAQDLPRRSVAERIGLSPMQVREREEQVRRLLLDVLARDADENTPPNARETCTALRPELARLLVDGTCKRCDEVLLHVRGCVPCRGLYDTFAIVEPSDAILEGPGGFRPDVDMDIPPRLAARVTSVIPADASEEVPLYARFSGHVITTVALTLAAFVAIAIVTYEDDSKGSVHVTMKPVVTMRVACVMGEGDARTVAVIDETLTASDDTGVRHDCPRGAALAITAKASVPGRAVVRVDEELTFGPDALDGETMRALTGTLPLTALQPSTLAVRLVFVAGDVEDAIVVARAEHPLPQDVVIERTVRVTDVR